MAFSCFSAIPMPRCQWDDRNMRYMMAAFPLVGLVVGACMVVWQQVCTWLGIGEFLRGVVLALIPLVVSGGIHMDGFADVIDAQSSHAPVERKRQILKDPHAGAFAIMGICGYLLTSAALYGESNPQDILALACIPVASRCLSGFATVTLQPQRADGMYAAEKSSARTHVVQGVLVLAFACVASGMVFWAGVAGGVAACAGILSVVVVRRFAQTQFGGMSGDLSGFLLQVAELLMLACIVVVGKLV
jgi:adenosylcobinamide-GDP ribazoletransferase